VISLRKISFAICISSLFTLLVFAVWVKGYDNLFFAGAKLEARANTDKASELYLAYETAQMTMDGKLLYVNHQYRQIMGYEIVSGGFFTSYAQEEKRKNAVLNRKAAFDSFGSFDIAGNIYKIAGEPYVVVGVIDDKQEEKNVYIPAGDTAGYFLVVMETEEKAIADLKSLNVSNNMYNFANLNESARVVKNKPRLALIIAAVLFIVLLILKAVARLKGLIYKIRQKSNDEYWNEVLSSEETRKFLAYSAAVIAGIVAVLWMLLQAAEIILLWTKYASNLDEIVSLAFGGKVLVLQKVCMYSNIAFCLFIGGMIIGGIAFRQNQ